MIILSNLKVCSVPRERQDVIVPPWCSVFVNILSAYAGFRSCLIDPESPIR